MNPPFPDCRRARDFLEAAQPGPLDPLLDHLNLCGTCQAYFAAHETEFAQVMEQDPLQGLAELASAANHRVGLPARPRVESDPFPWPVPDIDGFLLREAIGNSRHSQVFVATQTSLNRPVALKIVRTQDDPARNSTLAREAGLMASIKSPNILTVHGTGAWEEGFWLALEYCPRGSLADALERDGRWGEKPAADVIRKVALAAEAAHQAGVIHRDIKPANILLAQSGEPKLCDFGFAGLLREMDQSPGRSRLIGTPAYIAPEQVGNGRVDARSDIHALGAVLYHLLTGHAPFRAESRYEAMLLAAHTTPVHPCLVTPALSRDLGEICMKCLAKDPELRYRSARELAQDLERFQQGKAVLARPLSKGERFTRWVRQNPVLAGVSGTALALLISCAAGFAGLSYWAMLERTKALASEREAQQQKALARFQHYAGNLRSANFEWDSGYPKTTRELLEGSPFGQRGWEHDFITWKWRQHQVTLQGHTNPVLGLAASPDGKWLASGGDDRTLRLWDLKTGQPQVLGKSSAIPLGICFSADGGTLAFLDQERQVKIWDMGKRQWAGQLTIRKDRRLGRTRFGEPIALSRDGRLLFCEHANQRLGVWDTRKGTMVTASEPVHRQGIRSIVIDRSGKKVATGGGDGVIRLWDAATYLKTGELWGHSGAIRSLCFSADGKRLFSAANDHTLRAWDLDKKLATGVQSVDAKRICSLSVSPDDKQLVSGNEASRIRFWDAVTLGPVKSFTGHENLVRSVIWIGQGNRLASADWDGEIRVWDALAEQGFLTLMANDLARALRFSPDCKVVASGANNGLIQLWDADSGKELRRLTGQNQRLRAVSFHPDGTRLASGGNGSRVAVWDVVQGKVLAEAKGLEGPILDLCYSTDGKWLYGAGSNGEIALWDASNLELRRLTRAHTEAVTGIGLSHDGLVLAASSGDRTLTLWETVNWKLIARLEGFATGVRSVAISPDGRRVAGGCADGIILEWEMPAGGQVPPGAPKVMPGHKGEVTRLEYSPDGKRLLSASLDNELTLWDTRYGLELLSMPRHQAPVRAATFSPDGRRIASSADDGRILVRSPDTRLSTMRLEGFPNGEIRMGFTPEKNQPVVEDANGTQHFFSAETGERVVKPVKSPERVTPEALSGEGRVESPDGSWILEKDRGGVVLVNRTLREQKLARNQALLKLWGERK